jgi:phage terminase small subunit
VNVVPTFTGKMPTRGVKLFIDQYLVDFNAAQAAVRVGRTKGWSESHGARLLREYSDYVEWQQKVRAVENAKQVALDQEGILAEMELIATANIQDYFTWREVEWKDGKKTVKKNIRVWKDPGELTRAQAAAVERVELNADGQVTDYILYDKDSNLFSLGRHLGMFSEKVILEHRHKHLHAKIDLSKMPLDKLLEMESEFVKYIPAHQREAQ